MSSQGPTAPPTPISPNTGSLGNTPSQENYQSTPVKLIELPAGLQNLDRALLLGARLVGANTDGSVVLRTAQGDVRLAVQVDIPVNSPVHLHIKPGPPPSAVLLMLDNSSQQADGLGQLSNPSLFGSNALNQSSATLASANLVDLKLGNIIRALVMQPNSQVVGTPLAGDGSLLAELSKPGALSNVINQLAAKGGLSENAQAQLMTQLGMPGKLPSQVANISLSARQLETIQQTLQLLQQQSGDLKGLSNNQSVLQNLFQSGQVASTAQANNTAVQAGQLAPGTQLNLKLVQIIPPGQAQSMPTLLPGQIAGEVTSQLINSQPVVQTSQGSLLLQATNRLPTGTTIIFQGQELPASVITAGPQAEVLRATHSAPKLEQALLAMQAADMGAMQNIMNAMPRMNGQFPVAALFFLQALRSGDVRNWLGEKAMDGLGRMGGGQKLLDELKEEFKSNSEKSKPGRTGEWRQFSIPYLGEAGIATMQMAVRDHIHRVSRDESSHDTSQKEGELTRVTRFLFDTHFSELGAMQIDGLVRPRGPNGAQLDLIIRSYDLLPSEMRRDLRRLFEDSLETYGLQGGLSFQAGFQNWVKLAGDPNLGAQA